MRGFATALLAVAALGSPAAAFDKVLLKDGRTIEGTLVAGTDASVVRLKVKAIEVAIPASEVEKTFEENLDNYKPKTPEEEDNLKKGFVLFEGHWMSKTGRDDLLAKRAGRRQGGDRRDQEAAELEGGGHQGQHALLAQVERRARAGRRLPRPPRGVLQVLLRRVGHEGPVDREERQVQRGAAPAAGATCSPSRPRAAPSRSA